MIEIDHTPELLVLLVGLVIVLTAAIRALFRRLIVPALVGYLVLGFLLRVIDTETGILSEAILTALNSLANIGLVALLFRIGMRSNAKSLVGKLPKASILWAGDITMAALFGFSVSYFLLDLGLTPSLVVATALTATSVGVSVSAWDEAGALGSGNGQLLIDVAELDDISAIALMALLFTLLPIIADGHGDPWSAAITMTVDFVAKLVFFAVLCYLFAHYLERRVTRVATRLERTSEQMLTVVGLGFIIAALAGWLGFSLAIGALFAGLVFSRDPVANKIESPFNNLYEFFTPFFFVGIGLQVDPAALGAGMELGGALLVAAVLGKMLGPGLPALLTTTWRGATLIGISMVPRAEIAMVIMDQGRHLGPWAVTEPIYAAMVLVTAASCIISPLTVRPLLRSWRQTEALERPPGPG